MNYCTVQDIENTWRPLSETEIAKAENLIEQVSAELRVTAGRYGVDLETMVETDSDYALVVKSVCIDTVGRVLNQNPTNEPLSQFSQSAGGYSISGTYLTAGGGTLILSRDLRRLGLRRQSLIPIDIYGVD